MEWIEVRKKLRRYFGYGRAAAAFIALLALGYAPHSQAAQYVIPSSGDAVVGEDQTVETVYEDTLYDLARTYGLGSEELIRVNPGIDPWLPGAGKKIVVPGRHILPSGPREGIVVNLPEHRLYYYPKPKRGGPAGRHLPGQHRQDGLAHAAWAHPRDGEAEGSDLVPTGIGARGAPQGRRSPARERAARARQSFGTVCAASGRGQGHVPDPRHE